MCGCKLIASVPFCVCLCVCVRGLSSLLTIIYKHLVKHLDEPSKEWNSEVTHNVNVTVFNEIIRVFPSPHPCNYAHMLCTQLLLFLYKQTLNTTGPQAANQYKITRFLPLSHIVSILHSPKHMHNMNCQKIFLWSMNE